MNPSITVLPRDTGALDTPSGGSVGGGLLVGMLGGLVYAGLTPKSTDVVHALLYGAGAGMALGYVVSKLSVSVKTA